MTNRSSSSHKPSSPQGGPGSRRSDRSGSSSLAADVRRVLVVWVVILAVALGVIWWFGQSGSRLLSRLAYTSPVAWEVAQVYRADGTQGWRECLERVSAMRQGGKPLQSAIGVLKGDPTLEKARADLLKAQEFGGQFEEVSAMLADLSLWDGDAAEAYAWRGDEAAERKQWGEALAAYSIANNMGKDTAQVEEGRLDALIQLERWDAATSEALALRDKPYLTSRYYRLVARIDAKKGNGKELEAALRKAIEMNPRDVKSVFGLADYLVATARLEEAFNLYERTARLVTNNVELWHRLGVLSVRMGKLDQAVGFYRKAIQLAPNIYNLHYELYQLYVKLGDPNRAQPQLDRAFELNPKLFQEQEAKRGK